MQRVLNPQGYDQVKSPRVCVHPAFYMFKVNLIYYHHSKIEYGHQNMAKAFVVREFQYQLVHRKHVYNILQLLYDLPLN